MFHLGAIPGVAHGPEDWYSSITRYMDASPEWYPTFEEAWEVFKRRGGTWALIDIAMWRYDHKLPVERLLGERREARTRRRRPSHSALPAGVEAAEVRAWARRNGYEVASAGRLPAEVIDRFKSSGERTA